MGRSVLLQLSRYTEDYALQLLSLIHISQAQALLESPSPLADVYRYFEKLETGHMDVIRDSIENLSLIHI